MAPGPTDPSDPATGQSPAVQAAFAQLRARFLAGLPQRWAEIAAAPAGAARAAVLHRLTGAAGGFGLMALSEAARQAEQAGGSHEALLAVRREIEAAGVTVP